MSFTQLFYLFHYHQLPDFSDACVRLPSAVGVSDSAFRCLLLCKNCGRGNVRGNRHACEPVYLPAISRTTRKRALPLIIRSYASAAFSNGKISFMECTSADVLNSSVSCESMDVPEYQPLTDR